ncbi:MAG: trypsin-like peptidase domain-containing protein [Chloroflexota bacterium]|nr:trypsin-like peptidase domain-containing protein [Chloroflexota bacterium]
MNQNPSPTPPMPEPTREGRPLRLPGVLYLWIGIALLLAAGLGGVAGYLAGGRASAEYPDEVLVVTQPVAIDSGSAAAAGDFTGVAAATLPAVVTVMNQDIGNVPEVDGQPPSDFSSGTGFFFDSSGLLLTNNHVVQGRDEVRIVLFDGTFLDAEVIGRDPYLDTAILRAPPGQYVALELGSSDRLRVGEQVLAIGSPLRSFEGTVTAGIVSGLGRHFPNRVRTEDGDIRIDLINMIQLDASLNSGNSGGPLLNLDGEVVGVNTGKEQGAEGIGFALAMSDIKLHLDALVEDGRTDHGYLGVRYSVVNEDIRASEGLRVDRGALVVSVVADSTARAAGIALGDVILTVNGQDLDARTTLGKAIWRIPVGDAIEFEVDRLGEKLTLATTLQGRPTPLY